MAIIRRLIIAVLIVLFPIISNAASVWQISPAKSKIEFKATQNGAPVTGEFKSFQGDIDFDKNNLAKSQVKISVDISSVSTSYKEVGDTLKTPDWFDAKAFPKAIFTANDFKKTNENSYTANGQLTLRDKTLPLIVNFTFDKYTDKEAIATGKAELKRTAFTIGRGEWASTKEIKDEVEITFKIEATK